MPNEVYLSLHIKVDILFFLENTIECNILHKNCSNITNGNNRRHRQRHGYHQRHPCNRQQQHQQQQQRR